MYQNWERPDSAIAAQSRFLQGISEEDVAGVLSRASQQAFKSGAWIFRQGDAARQFFLLLAGRVRVHQVTPDGRELLLALKAPGEIFGYNAFSDVSTFEVSARAVEASRVAAWSSGTVRELMLEYPRMAVNSAEIMADHLRNFVNRYGYLATKTLGERIAHALAEVARRFGSRADDGIVVRIGGKDLAQLAGTTVYSVSRILSEWERRGLLKKSRGRITVFSLDALEELSKEESAA